MPSVRPRHPSALVSWAHADSDWSSQEVSARKDAVRSVSDLLRLDGIDADVDLYHDSEAVDWSRWGPKRAAECDFVLVVVSKAWRLAWEGRGDTTKGAGAAAEADVLRSEYARNRETFLSKVRLLLLPGADPEDIPDGLHGVPRYPLNSLTRAGLTGLLRSLTDQPEFIKADLGPLRHLPARSPAPAENGAPDTGGAAPGAHSVPPLKQNEPSAGQRNARAKAREYLRYTAFSEEGLVRQLMSEGFSSDDSRFAVVGVGADWSEQAATKAREYLTYSAFSRASLSRQLVFDGFTIEEAESAAANSGAVWAEQAARKAGEYLSYGSFSLPALVRQLVNDGFTDGEAESGAAESYE